MRPCLPRNPRTCANCPNLAPVVSLFLCVQEYSSEDQWKASGQRCISFVALKKSSVAFVTKSHFDVSLQICVQSWILQTSVYQQIRNSSARTNVPCRCVFKSRCIAYKGALLSGGTVFVLVAFTLFLLTQDSPAGVFSCTRPLHLSSTQKTQTQWSRGQGGLSRLLGSAMAWWSVEKGRFQQQSIHSSLKECAPSKSFVVIQWR